MDRKPKAQSPAMRTAKAKKAGKERPQREQFIEAARSIGVDETGKEFDTGLKKILKPRQAVRGLQG
jgi:hypothetical protein